MYLHPDYHHHLGLGPRPIYMWRGPTKLPPPPNEALATRGFVQNEKCKHDDNDIKHDYNNVNMMTKTLNMITTTLDMITTTYKRMN